MPVRVFCVDSRERQVVRFWQSGHLAPSTIKLYLYWVRHFRLYCRQHQRSETEELSEEGVQRFTQVYVGPRTKTTLSAHTCQIVDKALHAWARALQALGPPLPAWRPEKVPLPLPPLLAAYRQFRLTHNGIAVTTFVNDLHTATLFLAHLTRREHSLQNLHLADLDSFVQLLAESRSRKTVADTCSYLRAFLRFLHMTGQVGQDWATHVCAPHVSVQERPPRALPWADVRRLLAAIPQTEPPGKRDFAMLLLLATYGLGAAEILALRLEDIDWKANILSVRRPKTGTLIELPLLPPVARALASYLQKERPPTATRHVFVRANMPYQPCTSSAIRYRIRHYARQAGLTASVIGAHAFRHSHATRQVDAGTSLKMVGDILGHRRPSSTSVYVRVALRRLRTVALPVPR